MLELLNPEDIKKQVEDEFAIHDEELISLINNSVKAKIVENETKVKISIHGEVMRSAVLRSLPKLKELYTEATFQKSQRSVSYLTLKW